MKLFNKWETSQIKVEDPALQEFVNLKPVIVPRTSGRYAKNRFWKSKYHIVERLMNKLMTPGHRGKKHFISSGHCSGMGTEVYRIVKSAFSIIETQTKKNPI